VIATCNECGVMFFTTEEDACTPGVKCPRCYLGLPPEAGTYGENRSDEDSRPGSTEADRSQPDQPTDFVCDERFPEAGSDHQKEGQ